ncbi:MAG: 5-oxoprolinase subunit PxpB [Halioglobus sp.]
MKLRAVGTDALMLYLGDSMRPDTLSRVTAARTAIAAELGDDLVDIVPSYASVLIVFDALRHSHAAIAARVRQALTALPADKGERPREMSLPVYYAPEAGEDLETLAQSAGLAMDEVIALHSGTRYRVYAIGFAPGFAYLGEVNARIAQPRKATPRARVPRGAVGIADRQTAVYPSVSPGGWNLIGRCPLRLFDPQADPCMPLQVGDSVRFEPITRERFLELGGELP